MVRRALLSFFLLVLSLSVAAQDRRLVSPREEIVALPAGSDVRGMIRRGSGGMVPSSAELCSDRFYFGATPGLYPMYFEMQTYHKDVVGQWYVAPADGIIDSIYFQMGSAVGAYDSTIFVNVHRSYIGPSYGPGVRPGPYSPPCRPWGYWINTNDDDMGIAAFYDDATDTGWVSTIDGVIPSTPPIGEEMWGYNGVPVDIRANEVGAVGMAAIGETLRVRTGDLFFISLRTAHQFTGPELLALHSNPELEQPTLWAASSFDVYPGDVDYPSRAWKFYEHDRGPSTCAGLPLDSIRRGWIARGGLTDPDSTNVTLFGIWYSMHISTNVPPVGIDIPRLPDTFDSTGRSFQVFIEDCDPAEPESAGVAGVVVRSSVNGAPQPDQYGVYKGADTWEIPFAGRPPGSVVEYSVAAYDLRGDTSVILHGTYAVRPFGTAWYSVDTSVACLPDGIGATGTEVAQGEFFLPPQAGPGADAPDDGTAGPFDLGRDFVLFGGVFRYAWVGVNGAVGLTLSPDDTLHLDPSGVFDPAWDFPIPHPDTICPSCPPSRALIAPLRADFLLADSSGAYGRVMYGNGGDPCRFIVLWDSVGYSDASGHHADGTTFSVVLDACAGTVDFRYDRTGGHDQHLANLSGMQFLGPYGSPGEDYVFLNRHGYPAETRLTDGSCVRFYPNVGRRVDERWNLMAVSAEPLDGDYSADRLFPGALSRAWGFDGGYVPLDTLLPGRGFWMKFGADGPVGSSAATFIDTLTVPVSVGWNLVGGPSCVVPAGAVVPTGATLTTPFFGYGPGGWFAAAELLPGHSYWVKCSGAGTLRMVCGSGSGAGVNGGTGFPRE